MKRRISARKFDYAKISDVEIDGVDEKDAPDFVDAFIKAASLDGREMSESEIDELNEDRSFVYEQVLKGR
jgi:hypothetical protein